MGRRPSERVDEAFQIWSTDGNLNDTRTAQIMGIAQETVSYWHRTYGWDGRYLSLSGVRAEQMVNLAQATIRASLPAVTTRLLHIATATKPMQDEAGNVTGETYASTDRDAIQAAKLLYQYGLDTDQDIGASVFDAHSYVSDHNGSDIASLEGLDREAQVSRMLEATYNSVNTRPDRSRKRT